jgi:HSP20 family protein
MTLVRWFPFQELEGMERRMRRMLDEIGVAPPPLPAVDLYEAETEYVVELEVPGFEEKELGIEVTDHTLRVKGERVETKEEKAKTFFLHERLDKKFERAFTLPAEADIEKLTAEFRRGVLIVHAPKAITAQPRKVAIGPAK